MYATVSLSLVLSVAALSTAAPYYLQGPQQRQLFYQVVPQYSQYPAVAPAALPYQQLYYPPQAPVSPLPALRYPASASPLASPFGLPVKQVFYYPGPGGPYILAGDESANEGYWNSIYNTISNYFTGTKPAESAEKPAESGAPAEEASAEKITAAKEGEKENESEEAKPQENAKVKGAPGDAVNQKYLLVGQPQFFGNYGLRVNPAAVIPSADHGAVSSYLLLKNFPGVRFAPQVPQTQVPQNADAEVAPGSAALGYQQFLQQASASRQQKEFEDDASITVDADADGAVKSEGVDAEKPAEAADDAAAAPEEEQTGTNE